MNPNIAIHPIQTKVLLYLLFHLSARFSELNQDKVPSDQFTFHLKALAESGLVQKDGDKYLLTPAGKEFANRFDVEQKVVERQPKTSVCVVGVKYENGERFCLVQQKRKQPHYGFYASITGKIRWGERVCEAAEREFLEETGLRATCRLAGIEHKMDYDKDGNLLEDKFFFVCAAENPTGELIEEFEGGRNLWVKESDLPKLEPTFSDMPKVHEMVKNPEFTFWENICEEKWY